MLIEDVGTPDEIRDLFIRLQAGTALTRQQVRDAWPGNVGPYVEMLAGRLQRRGRYNDVFTAVDKRGSRREDIEDLDAHQADRQTCAQLLCLFLQRRRAGRIQNLGARDLDDLYHKYVDFAPDGTEGQEFEQLLEWIERIIRGRPLTTGNTRVKIRKNQLFSLFLLLDDLVRVGNVPVERELGKIQSRFWQSTADEEDEPTIQRVALAATIAAHYEWFKNQRLVTRPAERTFAGG